MPALLLRPRKVMTVAVLAFLLSSYWPQLWQGAILARSALYGLVREYEGFVVRRQLAGWKAVSGPGIEVRYLPGDEAWAETVLAMAEEMHLRVQQALGYDPGHPVLIAIHPDQASLQGALDWGMGQEALGVYESGVIRLLSPRAWIFESDPVRMEEAFRIRSPLPHELAHFVLDYATDGNHPRWFSEGLAQWYEYQLTGYWWLEGGPRVEADPYSFGAIDRMLARPQHQARAYRQALLMTVHLEQITGNAGGLPGLVSDLARGIPWPVALESRSGLSWRQWELAWRSWVQEEGRRWAEPTPEPPLKATRENVDEWHGWTRLDGEHIPVNVIVSRIVGLGTEMWRRTKSGPLAEYDETRSSTGV